MADPAGISHYLNKWGIGAELTGEMIKLGRNGDNVPHSATLPSSPPSSGAPTSAG